jgi:hypothetical protein
MNSNSAPSPTTSWLPRFGVALITLFLAAVTVVIFCFLFTGSERKMEISSALVFPIPHLLALLWPFKAPTWSLAALQLILYAALIAKVRRVWIAASLLVFIHTACIGVHLCFKGLVP